MKEIKGYEGLYAVTKDGQIFSYKSKRFLKPRKRKDCYLQVTLCKDDKQKQCYLHRLIAETYLPNPDNLPQVNHKDEDKTNNALTNLEWCDAAYNINYSKAKKVICVETGEIFSSTVQAAKAKNTYQGNISHCLAGRRKTAAGYHWCYYDEENN